MRHIIVLVIANTFWAASAAAQSTNPNVVFGEYQQINWQERDGLPQNWPRCWSSRTRGVLIHSSIEEGSDHFLVSTPRFITQISPSASFQVK